MLANVKIIEDEDHLGKFRLSINGHEISGIVCGVKTDIGVGCVPTVTVELIASPFEYSGEADVQYDFIPESVNEAARIVKVELAKKGDAYKDFINEIDKALSKAYVESARAMHYAESLDFAESVSESTTYTARYIANALLGLGD